MAARGIGADMAEQLSGYDKAAILLHVLGEEAASELLKHLTPEEIRRMGVKLSRLPEATQKNIEEVLEEFFKLTGASGQISKEYLRSLLSKTLGQLGQAKVKMAADVVSPEMEALQWMDPKAICNIIRNEHPQAIALILANLNLDQSVQILTQLPEALRGDVLMRMATLEEIPPGVLHEVSEVLEEVLEGELKRVQMTPSQQVGGTKMVASILSQMERSAEQKAIAAITQVSAPLGEEIRELMFVFDDLVKLDDRAIQEVLKEASKDQLAVALRAAKENVKEKIFKNMSERAVEIMKEDMESRGPMKLSDVEKAQQSIVKTALRLVDEGKIVIGKSGAKEAEAMV